MVSWLVSEGVLAPSKGHGKHPGIVYWPWLGAVTKSTMVQAIAIHSQL